MCISYIHRNGWRNMFLCEKHWTWFFFRSLCCVTSGWCRYRRPPSPPWTLIQWCWWCWSPPLQWFWWWLLLRWWWYRRPPSPPWTLIQWCWWWRWWSWIMWCTWWWWWWPTTMLINTTKLVIIGWCWWCCDQLCSNRMPLSPPWWYQPWHDLSNHQMANLWMIDHRRIIDGDDRYSFIRLYFDQKGWLCFSNRRWLEWVSLACYCG